MTVVPAQATIQSEDSALLLARYAAVVSYRETAFWGVNYSGDTNYACRRVWTKPQRDAVATALAEAQIEIEDQIGYLLSPRWIVGDVADEPNHLERFTDVQPFRPSLHTRWPQLLAPGIRATEDISLGEALTLSVAFVPEDPISIGPIATTVTDVEEVHFYHPNTDYEIIPSSVAISGGFLTAEIPRARLVAEALVDNPEAGLDYTVDSNFEAEVDIKRVYTSNATNAVLVYPRCPGCTVDTTQTACLYIRDARLGQVLVRPATYVSGAWTGSGAVCCGRIDRARLYYRAGLLAINRQHEEMIVRLAHSKMPDEPCGCEVTQRMWQRDREIPPVMDRERLNCPFGLSNGAWYAWMFASQIALKRGGYM